MRRAVLAVAALACALAPVAAGAIGISVSPSSTSTSTVTLNGVDQEPTVNVNVTVSGANNSGWRITAYAAQPASGSQRLPALEVTSEPVAGACSGKNCVNASPTGISWPVTLGTTSGSASKIYNSAASTGTGTIVVRVPFGVTVPANVRPGTYTTTITLTITNNGP